MAQKNLTLHLTITPASHEVWYALKLSLTFELSLLWLCREACSSKYGSLHFYVVVRVQTLANAVVGIFPLRDDWCQTTKHPVWKKTKLSFFKCWVTWTKGEGWQAYTTGGDMCAHTPCSNKIYNNLQSQIHNHDRFQHNHERKSAFEKRIFRKEMNFMKVLQLCCNHSSNLTPHITIQI